MRTALGLLVLSALAGCTSYGATNTPVTKENAVAVPEIIGHWSSRFDPAPGQTEGEPICISVEPAEALTYRGRTGCAPEPEGILSLQFIHLGGELIAVLQSGTSDESLEGNSQVVFLYSFYRVRIRGDSLFAIVLDADSLRTYLPSHPVATPFVLLERDGPLEGQFPDVLLTGTPDQLAAFLATHARDSTLWGGDDGEIGFVRVR